MNDQSKEPLNSRQQDGSLLVAVYGTLRKGFGNHAILNNENCELLGTFRTPPVYKMVSLGGFPGVIINGEREVTLEIYRVNDSHTEHRLDRLEGYPSFYQKTVLETPWGHAEMYVLSEEEYGHLTVIQSGDWVEHRKQTTYNY